MKNGENIYNRSNRCYLKINLGKVYLKMLNNEEINSQELERNPQEETDASSENLEQPNQDGNETGGAEQLLTQEQVNQIVQERLKRQNEAFFKKYGVENGDELTEKLKLSEDYKNMEARYTQANLKVSELSEQLAFIENHIDKNRYDDVKTYFKGKGLEFSSEELLKAISTHPEWLEKNQESEVKETTINKIGFEHDKKNFQETPEEKMKRIFGI